MAVNSLFKKGRITKGGTFTVTVAFDGGTALDLTFDDFVSAVNDTVSKMTGTTDVRVTKGGGAFVLTTPDGGRTPDIGFPRLPNDYGRTPDGPTLADVLGLPYLPINDTTGGS